MGTRYQVQVVASVDGPAKTDLHRVIENVLDGVDRRMSTYRDDSELTRFNVQRTTDRFPVSAALASVVSTAQEVSRSSGGAFDVTVGPLVEAWGFGATPSGPAAPAEAELVRLLAEVGYRFLEVDVSPPALRKVKPELEVDLSAIAKGYAVDCLADSLTALGYEDHLVEVGGEVRCGGVNHEGRPWAIGVESPREDGGPPVGVLALSDRAVATSGSYRNWRVVEGRRISHTIDPRTGRPVEHEIAAVTVVAPRCIDADAQATAISVLGLDAGLRYAESNGLAVQWWWQDAAGDLQDRATEAFDTYRRSGP